MIQAIRFDVSLKRSHFWRISSPCHLIHVLNTSSLFEFDVNIRSRFMVHIVLHLRIK